MRWVTRAGVHVDRAACAWLIRRYLDPNAEFCFIEDVSQAPADATPFDIRGAELGHHDNRCSFESMLRHFDLNDPALEELGRIVHEADLADDTYDAPLAAGLDAVIRGLSFTHDDDTALLTLTDQIFHGLYEYTRRRLLTGRPPA